MGSRLAFLDQCQQQGYILEAMNFSNQRRLSTNGFKIDLLFLISLVECLQKQWLAPCLSLSTSSKKEDKSKQILKCTNIKTILMLLSKLNTPKEFEVFTERMALPS